MKIRRGNMTPWLAALVCLTLAPGTKATDEMDEPKAPTSQNDSSENQPSEQDVAQRWKLAHDASETGSPAMPNEGAPTKCNKASGLIGMDVRNQNDEHLGHIKDLVIDWKTEQVSYAVISTGSRLLLEVNEKLLAVPLTALTTSSDQKHLILNADKSKVAAATGFDANNWPSVSNPSWGAEPVWQKDTGTPSGNDQPASESDTNAKPNMTPGAKQEGTPEATPEKDPEMQPEGMSDKPAAPPAGPEGDMQKESKPDTDPEMNPDTEPEGK